VQKFLIQEEMAYHSGLEVLIAANMAGPVVLRRGSEEQKARYLPGISRGEVEFALGYTEPQAGSDLASLEMRVVRDGDYYVINGQKVFNTAAHYAQYHWLGARTDTTVAKHKGISLFIVDLKTPGIDIRPIWALSRRTNEIFYDNVRVHKSCLVGEENKGWIYIGEALGYERTWIAGDTRRLLDKAIEYAKQVHRPHGRPADDPIVRNRLAELATELEVCYLFGVRNAWMLDNGMMPGYEASMAKLFGSELQTRVANATMQVLGLYSQLLRGDSHARIEGTAGVYFNDSPRPVITRGASEVMRNVIAQRGLGLPRT